jgi:hypothetical protein
MDAQPVLVRLGMKIGSLEVDLAIMQVELSETREALQAARAELENLAPEATGASA